MRNLLLAGLLLAAVLAGCLDGDEAPDADDDGLSDAREGRLRTNPNNPDTDGDGLLDGAEEDAGTNATLPDSDGDGTFDGAEVANGTDPLDPASGGYAVPEVPAVDAGALLADHAAFVTQFPKRRANEPTHEGARQALLAAFESYGLEAYRHNFTEGIEQANIVGIRWGVVRDQWVVVGAHYDTVDQVCALTGADCTLSEASQGAYDDGSGTFLTMHLAKAFSQVQPYYTMAFVAFDGEERGTQGARAFVRDFMLEPSTPYGQVLIMGDVDLDMVGINWPGTNAPLNVLTNSEKAYEVANTYRQGVSWPDDQWIRKDALTLGSSDYARFWEVSDPQPVPTIFFISGFEEAGAPAPAPPVAHTPATVGYYPFWHMADTVETMTAMAGGADNLQAGFQAMVDLAAHILHAMACQPGLEFDAVPK